jgi:hypothetical protein
MGKNIESISENGGYQVFATAYEGVFYFSSSSYSCFEYKKVTEITEWSVDGDDHALRTNYEIKSNQCSKADPQILLWWQHNDIELIKTIALVRYSKHN